MARSGRFTSRTSASSDTLLPHTGQLIMPGSSSWAPNSLTVSNGQVAFPGGFQLSVTNDLVLMANGAITLTNVASLPIGNISPSPTAAR